MIEIELTFDEMRMAATRGCERQIDAAIKRRHHGHGDPGKRTTEGWGWNINGACGEAVVAKWLGVPWTGCFGDLRASDVAFLEVRTTTGHDFPLRLHDDDKDDSVYVLVTGVAPVWRIQGYIYGQRGKNKAWFHDRPPPVGRSTGFPAYWVPQDQLKTDLTLLKERFLARYSAERKTA